MISVETAEDSRSKMWIGSTLLGIPPCLEFEPFDFRSPISISGCMKNMSLYGTRLYATGAAAIAETVRVAGVLKMSVGVYAMGASKG